MKKVIELIRVSTQSQAGDDRASIPSQRAANRRTAEVYGLEITKTIEMTDVLLFEEVREKVTEHEVSWLDPDGIRQKRDACHRCRRDIHELMDNLTRPLFPGDRLRSPKFSEGHTAELPDPELIRLGKIHSEWPSK